MILIAPEALSFAEDRQSFLAAWSPQLMVLEQPIIALTRL